MEIRLLISLLIFFFSCGVKKEKDLPCGVGQNETRIENELADTIWVDSLTYYLFEYVDEEKFVIKWGGLGFENCSNDELTPIFRTV